MLTISALLTRTKHSTMNIAATLTSHVLKRLQELEPITEVSNNDEPLHIFHHPESGDAVGSIRLYKGENILESIVVVHIHATAMAMDAYMLMAFTQPDSLYPHLAFDTELLPNDSAFHIDLLHKRDFSTDIDYVQSVMSPLSEAFDAANSNPNFRFSDATHLMKALLNPWMASYHCLPEHLPEAKTTIDAYIDHWLSLANRSEGEVVVNTSGDPTVTEFDAAHRAAIFDPRVDVLWDMISQLIGVESRDLILKLVKGESSV